MIIYESRRDAWNKFLPQSPQRSSKLLRSHALGVVEPQRALEKTAGLGDAWRPEQKLSDIWEGS